MRELKFRRAHYKDKSLSVFSHFTYWGINVGLGNFTSPAFVSGAMYYIDEQFTGLQDKNGVDVYEEDIVLVPYNSIGLVLVKFNEGAYNISKYNISSLKVIGNIHEHPELIK